VLDLHIKSKPDWLNQAIPYIYSLAGLAALFFFESPSGYAAGALLILAACLIWIKRQQPAPRK